MLSSFYASPRVLNELYQPIENEHASFVYYFTEIIRALDFNKVGYEDKILLTLLNHYISFSGMMSSYSGRVVQASSLASELKTILETDEEKAHRLTVEASSLKLTNVFDRLNQNTVHINSNDDLIWLLSAFCSVFPINFLAIKNPSITNALKIRDINNLYFHTVMTAHINSELVNKHKLVNERDIKIALITDQFEEYLISRLELLTTDTDACLHSMPRLLRHATPAQVEYLILPPLLKLLQHELETPTTSESKTRLKPKSTANDKYRELTTIEFNILKFLPRCIAKLSPECIEQKVVPALISLFKLIYMPILTDESIRACIDKLDGAALKRSILPTLMDPKFAEEKLDNHEVIAKIHTYIPLIAMAAKLDKPDCDHIFEYLEPYYLNAAPSMLAQALSVMKKHRDQQLYINEPFYQSLEQRVRQFNDEIIASLRYHVERGRCADLQVWHLNAEQVEQFFNNMDFKQSTHNDEALYNVLTRMLSLPRDIYPQTLLDKACDYLFNLKKPYDENLVIAIDSHLSNKAVTDNLPKEVLLNICDRAITMIKSTRHVNSLGVYFNLISTCATFMTSDEIKNHIMPMIDLNKLTDTTYNKLVAPILVNAIKILDDDYVKKHLLRTVIKTYMSNVFSNEDELVASVIGKMSVLERVYFCRVNMKNNFTQTGYAGQNAYIFAEVYRRNKQDLQDIPEFCTGEKYQARKQEEKCVLM